MAIWLLRLAHKRHCGCSCKSCSPLEKARYPVLRSNVEWVATKKPRPPAIAHSSLPAVCASHLEINSLMLVKSSYVCSPSQPYWDERPWTKFMQLDHPCIPDWHFENKKQINIHLQILLIQHRQLIRQWLKKPCFQCPSGTDGSGPSPSTRPTVDFLHIHRLKTFILNLFLTSYLLGDRDMFSLHWVS